MTIYNLDILYTIENAVVCHRTLTIRRVDLLRQHEKCVHSAVNVKSISTNKFTCPHQIMFRLRGTARDCPINKCHFVLDCCTVSPKITTVICTFMKLGSVHLWSSARPPTEASWMCGASENSVQSLLQLFMASALRVLEAGFALNTQGSLVWVGHHIFNDLILNSHV